MILKNFQQCLMVSANTKYSIYLGSKMVARSLSPNETVFENLNTTGVFIGGPQTARDSIG